MDEEIVIEDELGRDLAVRAPVALGVTPQVGAGELKARLDVIREAMEQAMVRDVDYGVIPGTDKPTLLKPGAEKLAVLFQLDVQLVNEKHFDGGHLTVISKATVYHAPTGARLGFGEGMCSTREKKYAYRQQSRLCPACGAAAIIKGKAEYGGGWVCFKKKNGCGAKYADDDSAITGQTVGQIDNPDLPDSWNTILKMSEKRGRVDAILAVTGASALFTQDIEDAVVPVPGADEAAETDDWVAPKDWPELAKRLGERIGADEAPVWMAELAVKGYAAERIGAVVSNPEVPDETKADLWRRVCRVLHDFDTAEGDVQLRPDHRAFVAGVFHTAFDKALDLDGPAWSLSPTEADSRPQKDAVMGERANAPGEHTTPEDTAGAQPVGGEPVDADGNPIAF